MKISFRDLQGHYQAALFAQSPSPRKDCLSAAQIIGLLDRTRSRRRRAYFMDHLTRCSFCLQEYEVIRNLLRERDLCVKDLAAWAKRQQRKKQSLGVEDSRDEYGRTIGLGKHSGMLRRGWSLALSAAFLLGCLIIILSRIPIVRNIWDSSYRAGPETRILLVHPRQDQILSGRSIRFQWTPLPRAEYYVLEVFDASLRPIWKSPETRAARIILPPEVSARMKPSKPYYWLVTGALPDDRLAESKIGAFFISDE